MFQILRSIAFDIPFRPASRILNEGLRYTTEALLAAVREKSRQPIRQGAFGMGFYRSLELMAKKQTSRRARRFLRIHEAVTEAKARSPQMYLAIRPLQTKPFLF